MEKQKDKKNHVDFDINLGGIFKGLGSFIDMATELSEKFPSGVNKEGQTGDDKGIKAVYGFSMKMGGAAGKPIIESFGNIHEKEDKRGPVVDEVREPMVDIFDEGEFFLVVAEMPGVNEADISHEVKEDILIVSAQTGDRKYSKEVLLPAAVNESKVTRSYKNGILEVKLWKE
jgi:HSP20 family protein